MSGIEWQCREEKPAPIRGTATTIYVHHNHPDTKMNLASKTNLELYRLQGKLNKIFVRLRDNLANVQPIYRYLVEVEKELSKRKAFWR